MMQTTVTHKTTLLRTDGFVRNIHSRNPFDVIRADVVLARMEKRAGKTCGAYYEIYDVLCIGLALYNELFARSRIIHPHAVPVFSV